MSSAHENFLEAQIEAYDDYLHEMDDEELEYEFNEKLGTGLPNNYGREDWIAMLLENFSTRAIYL